MFYNLPSKHIRCSITYPANTYGVLSLTQQTHTVFYHLPSKHIQCSSTHPSYTYGVLPLTHHIHTVFFHLYKENTYSVLSLTQQTHTVFYHSPIIHIRCFFTYPSYTYGITYPSYTYGVLSLTHQTHTVFYHLPIKHIRCSITYPTSTYSVLSLTQHTHTVFYHWIVSHLIIFTAFCRPGLFRFVRRWANVVTTITKIYRQIDLSSTFHLEMFVICSANYQQMSETNTEIRSNAVLMGIIFFRLLRSWCLCHLFISTLWTNMWTHIILDPHSVIKIIVVLI